MCRSWGVTQRAVRTAIEVPMSGVNRYTNIVNDIRFVRVAISHNVTLLRSVPCRFFCSASRHFHTSLVSFISLNLTTLLRFVPYRLFYTAKRHFLCSFVSFTSLSKKVSRRTLALACLGHPRSRFRDVRSLSLAWGTHAPRSLKVSRRTIAPDENSTIS